LFLPGRELLYQLTRKRIREDRLPVRDIWIKREELSFFSLSTHSILSFRRDGTLWFFRECPRLLTGEAYWNEAVEAFFDSLDRLHIDRERFAQEIPIRIRFTQEEIAAFRAYLARRRACGGYSAVLRNADRTARRLGFSIWTRTTWDAGFFSAFGMPDLPEECRDVAVYFLWNMRTAARNLRLSRIVRGGNHSFFSAVRSVSSRIVARELGLGHMITPYTWCRLHIDQDRCLLGLASPCAPGVRMLDADPTPDASLQRELTCLNMLDAVCGQRDHGPNNYNVLCDGGRYSVCAFDNDEDRAFFPSPGVGAGLSGCAPLVDAHGRIRRPHMDRDMAEAMAHIRPARLKKQLRPYLNGLQIAALLLRLRALNRAIAATQKDNDRFLLRTDQWDADSLAGEIGGRWGQTYLTKAVSAKKQEDER
jgi:hypothetical protein